jgi:hypothetical protein
MGHPAKERPTLAHTARMAHPAESRQKARPRRKTDAWGTRLNGKISKKSVDKLLYYAGRLGIEVKGTFVTRYGADDDSPRPKVPA